MSKDPLFVYIAGPYSKGDKEENVKRAIEAGEAVLRKGHIPYVPHLTHYWDAVSPHPYTLWLGLGMTWLLVCNAVLRLPGESIGSDIEVAFAKSRNIPVIFSLDELSESDSKETIDEWLGGSYAN